ncbi:MAG: hypothetical protein LKJ21_04525 [Oscillospiraceae bacterium]|nr:hypothetical protein [Oscillospiraceae bacterium]MCI1990364.1 hypothetical protein [Oscillospiraceae bacterium]MCI2034698.1 hypothetical protein [Oscillospiraceae bacterium]
MKLVKKFFALLLCCALSVQFLPLRANGAGETGGKTSVDLLTELDAASPEEAFQTLNLNAAASEDDSLSLDFAFQLSDPYLQSADIQNKVDAFRVGLESAGEVDMDNQTAVDAAFTKASDAELPPVGFTFSCVLDPQTVSIPNDSGLLGTFALETESKEKIGTYTVSQGTGENPNVLTVACTLDKKIYNNRTGVSGSADLQLDITSEGQTGPTPDLGVENGKISVSVVFSGGGEEPNPADVDYKLEKSAGDRDLGDPNFTYTLKASATAAPGAPDGTSARVNGLTVRDPIPVGMEVASVEYGGETLSSDDYTVRDGVLTYTFPAYDSADPSSERISAELTVSTRLTKEKYQEYLNAESGVNWTFSNTATLYDKDQGKPLAASNTVNSKFQSTFLSKDGKREGVNGSLFHWTIHANTRFSSGDSVYLVDTVEGIDTTHQYVTNEGGDLPFKINETDETATKATSNKTYDSLTVENLDTLTDSGKNAVYYTYDSNEDETPDRAVLVIPLAQGEGVLNAPLTVTYDTKMLPRTSSDDYSNRTLKNTAKILWGSAGYGPGTGTVNAPSYEITKDVTADYSLLTKAPGGYTASKRALTWNFTVNRCGKALNGVTVTDVLDDGVQTFSGLTATLQTGADAPQNVTIPKDTADGSGRYYTLEPDKDTHQTTLTVHLGDVAADESYTLALTTTVADPTLLSTQGQNVGSVSNKADISATINEETVKKSVSASKGIPNTLLVKDALKADGSTGSGYNYQTHAVRWRITANPNHVPIDGAVLTDELPEGTTFGTLNSVKRTSTDGTSSSGTIDAKAGTVTFADDLTIRLENTARTGSGGYSKDTETFTFSTENPGGKNEISDRFDFDFTTVVDQDYRDAKFKTGPTDSSHDFVNVSSLAGAVPDPTGQDANGTPVNVSDDAKQTVSVPPVTKNGTYHDNFKDYPDLGTVSYADWTVVVNRDGIDMKGVQLKDELPDFLELDPDSVKIQKAKIDQNGKATPTGENITDGLHPGYSGFTFDIPDEYARTPLVLRFHTLVVGTANASAMKNTVTLVWEDGSETGSNEAGADGAADFNAENFATATRAPLLQVRKTSSNTAYDAGGSPLYKLAGAAFTLTPMAKDGSSGQWTADAGALSKVRTSGSTGLANFFFLKKDVLYRLTETKAPAGYQSDGTPSYYVFLGTTQGTDYPAEIGGIAVHVISSGSPAADSRPVVENEPENAEAGDTLAFTKKTDTGTPLGGVTFTLHDQSGKLKDRTAVSGADGTVKFANVDAGKYTLSETAPAGFRPAADTGVTVTLTNGVYSVQMTGASVSGSAADGYVLTNSYRRGTVHLVKTDSVSKAPVSGAAFSVYEKETDRLAAYLRESGTPGYYVLASAGAVNARGDPFVSVQSGKPALLAGDYYVTETATPDGYLPDTDASGSPARHAFSITADGQDVSVVDSSGTAFTNTPCGTITGKKVTGENAPLAGAVIGLFPAGTTDFTQENLYHGVRAASGADGSFTFARVPYGTYVVAELSAPAGYERNTAVSYTVTVDRNTGAITGDEDGKAIVIQNDLLPVGNLTIRKTSGDGTLKGFTFRVSGSGGSKEFTTDARGLISITGLPVGTYTVAEQNTALTSGRYVLPAAQTVRLTTVGAELKFYNKLAPKKPGGETENPPSSGENGNPSSGGPTRNPSSGETGAPTGTVAENPSGEAPAREETEGPKTGLPFLYQVSPFLFAGSLLGFSACLYWLRKKRGRR